MKTENLILASLIVVAATPAFTTDMQSKDPYTNGQAVTKADPHTNDACKAGVYTDGAMCKANPYTDGALRKADLYIGGASTGKADPFTDSQ